MSDYDAANDARKSYDVAIDAMREKLLTFRREIIGDAVLYLGDCREVLPLIPKAAAIVSDPPYGIAFNRGAGGRSAPGGATTNRNTGPIIGDDKPFDPSHLVDTDDVILWGANHFARRLPEGGRWLAWDKLAGTKSFDAFSDVEFAWHNKPGAGRIFSHLWKGILRDSEAGDLRSHQTQKPVALMQWCLSFVAPVATVCDPYMGSGTTGVACALARRKFVGIEIDAKHFSKACERISKAYAQGVLAL